MSSSASSLPRRGRAAAGAEQGAAARRALWTDLALVALFALALRLPGQSLSVFASTDEGAFVLAAREVLLGHLPYLTFWDHKPPGSTLMVAAAMALLGPSLEAVRALGLACVVGTAWALYLIARRVWPDRLVALGAAALYVAYSVRMCGSATIMEILLAPFAAGGVLLLLLTAPRADQRVHAVAPLFAAAGLAFGVAVWIKYVPAVPAALTAGLALCALLLRREPGGLARALGCAALFGLGLLLPTAAGVGLYWWAGALDAFWHANFGFAAAYVETADTPRGLAFQAVRGGSLAALQIWPLMLAAAAAAAFLPGCRRFLAAQSRGRSFAFALVALWLAGEALAVAAQMKFYDYQFLIALPPMCVLAAAAVRFHVARLMVPPMAARAAALTLGLMALAPVLHHGRAVAAALSREDVPRAIAHVLAGAMRPGDRVYVVNHEPIIYFLAGAPLPTRYAFPISLLGPHQALLDTDAEEENRRVLEAAPRFVVMNTSWRDDPVAWDAPSMTLIEDTLARRYAPLAGWVQAESKGTVRVFVRRD